jgi:hypothetical protein
MQKVRQPESTTRIIQQKIGKVPNNTTSTTKLSSIRELGKIEGGTFSQAIFR